LGLGLTVVAAQEYDPKHGVTIVKSIVEGVNYRFDDGSSTKALIKELKLLPRSVKEAAVRLNHFGKDFIRGNISLAKHANHAASPASPDCTALAAHSLHLHTAYASDSPSKHFPAKSSSPSSPSQLDPFLSLLPPHRQTHARQAAELFNSSVSHTSDFRARHDRTKDDSSSPLQRDSGSNLPPSLHLPVESRPVTSAAASRAGTAPAIDGHASVDTAAAQMQRKAAEDKKTELLFKRLTQDNPDILEKIKNMYTPPPPNIQTGFLFNLTPPAP